MKKSLKVMILLFLLLIIAGCGLFKKYFERPEIYNGRLEAETVKLSAQTTGIIDVLNVKEGDEITIGAIVAVIDKEKLLVQQRQILADLSFNKDLLQKSKKMLANGAATQQRVDELSTRVVILEAQKTGIELQLQDATIKSPLKGVVLNKYVNKGELVGPGTLIAEVADISELEAFIYLPLEKLPAVKIGQQVKIAVDGLNVTMPGKIVWIASESEFTPKTILTKETRTSLVYAVKIKVANKEQKLKIGMPIDVMLTE